MYSSIEGFLIRMDVCACMRVLRLRKIQTFVSQEYYSADWIEISYAGNAKVPLSSV